MATIHSESHGTPVAHTADKRIHILIPILQEMVTTINKTQTRICSGYGSERLHEAFRESSIQIHAYIIHCIYLRWFLGKVSLVLPVQCWSKFWGLKKTQSLRHVRLAHCTSKCSGAVPCAAKGILTKLLYPPFHWLFCRNCSIIDESW